jgi:hypothetical protein
VTGVPFCEKSNPGLVLGALVASARADAQSGMPVPQMVSVDGLAMRVSVTGLTERKPGQPAIILETGLKSPHAEHLVTSVIGS